MSLQTDTTAWRGIYDQTEINAYNSDYIGSIWAAGVEDCGYHSGSGIYDPTATPPTYEIYDFNWYAGQGVDHVTPGNGGGKFLVNSAEGFSWDTTYDNVAELYTFVTTGDLDTLYLGYTPVGDYNPSPKCATLATFDAYESLLVVTGFNIAVDAVAVSEFSVTDGNSAIAASLLVDDNGNSILANAGIYAAATLNSAVLYGLAFDNTTVQAFEFVLDKYLESRGSDITDPWASINAALVGTGVSITYYNEAGDYVADGVIACCPCCDCGCNDLLAA
ncbi:MAG: hypothetical protein LBF61_03080 [Azoarcus sp.]|jgi:hypothetical protein|nr:hypothetical protein [Azoarcus sp.]